MIEYKSIKKWHTLQICVEVISDLSYEGMSSRRCYEETKQEISNRVGVSVVTRHLLRFCEWNCTELRLLRLIWLVL